MTDDDIDDLFGPTSGRGVCWFEVLPDEATEDLYRRIVARVEAGDRPNCAAVARRLRSHGVSVSDTAVRDHLRAVAKAAGHEWEVR